MGVVRRLLRLGVLLAAIVLAVTVAAVLYLSDRHLRLHGQGRSLQAPVDAAIVLGAAVDPDGMLGYSSRRRVARGVALLESGRAEHVILSGGPIRHYRVRSAAELMREYAIELGAPPDSLINETRSHSTFANLRFSTALAQKMGFERLAIVTDSYHLERARWLAAYFGHGDIGLVAVRGLEYEGWHDQTWSVVREALAWWYNLAKVAGWELLAVAGLDARERAEWIR